MTKLYNQKRVKSKRKKLRSNMPLAEKLLWYNLRKKQVNNYKFRRQYSIGKYIVDFYCREAKLALEIDGDSHFSI